MANKTQDEYKSLKSDIKDLTVSLKESENKIYNRMREIENDASTTSSDLRLISSNMTNMAKQVGEFIDSFERHDENEMKKYSEIEKTQSDVKNELDSQKKEIKSMKDTQTTMKNNQEKFFKIIYIGSGIVLAFTIIGSGLKLYSDSQKVFTEPEKVKYYDRRTRETDTYKDLNERLRRLEVKPINPGYEYNYR